MKTSILNLKYILLISLAIVFAFGIIVVSEVAKPVKASEANNIIYDFATSSTAYVLSTATKIASYNPRRAFLEIDNISGATTTAQVIYCSTTASVTKFTGITIFASSTRPFYLNDMMPLANIYCISGNGTAAISVTER